MKNAHMHPPTDIERERERDLYEFVLYFFFLIVSFANQVVGIGNAGVGKTCLIKHFCESKVSNLRIFFIKKISNYPSLGYKCN